MTRCASPLSNFPPEGERAIAWLRPPRCALPACGITSDLAAVICSLVEWLVVSSRGLRRGVAEGEGMAALHLLMEQLASPLSQQAGRWLVIPQSAGCAGNVPARGRPMGSPLLRSDPFALSEVRPQHGGAEPSGAGVAASHLLPQSAGFASNVSEVLP
jgi:hypothetical protein